MTTITKSMYNKSFDKFWRFQKVRTLRELRNKKGDIIPVGTICKVDGKYKGFGVVWENPETKKYVWITRLHYNSFILIDELKDVKK